MSIDDKIRVRSLPLAACLMAALAAGQTRGAERARRPADVRPVTSCADDGSAGTLRSAVAEAASGDTIDMSELACGTITLASGAIPIAVDDLTLLGPGARALAVDGAQADRVIAHSGAGTLTISGITIENGRNASDAVVGGCIYSSGNVSLEAVTVSGCSTYGGSFLFAGGAGLAVTGNLSLVASTLRDNLASAADGAQAGSYLVIGGGAFVSGSALVVDSTISGNGAQGAAGSNGYHAYGGGLAVYGGLTARNSTIAFNSAGRGAGGVFGINPAGALDLQSTIVADNVASYAGYFSADIGGYGTISGANNLIVSSDPAVPGDTLNADPELLPLGDDGGPTPTHALPPTSPAVDAGNNASGLAFDQRGEGYPRVSGTAADIGAFEHQQATGLPSVAKTFAPDTMPVGSVSTLTITLGNPNATPATLTVDLVDDLPAPMVVAEDPAAATSCPDGAVTANPGADTVSLAGGATIPASGTCTVTLSVTSDAAGTLVNTIGAGALQTSLGSNPGAASASLTTTAQAPTLSKAFMPDVIDVAGTSTLTITLANPDAVPATLSADLVDTLPPALFIADPPLAATTCTDGTVVAEPGAGTVALEGGAAIPAGASCTVSVAIGAVLPGIFTNTIPAGALATGLGSNAAPASASLTVTDESADRLFADGFDGA